MAAELHFVIMGMPTQTFETPMFNIQVLCNMHADTGSQGVSIVIVCCPAGQFQNGRI